VAAYKRQTAKLLDDIKAIEEEGRDFNKLNMQLLQAFIGGDIEQVKAKLKSL